MDITFSVQDVDNERLHLRVKREADKIFSKHSTRNNRSYQEVFESCFRGHVAELYLIEKYNFVDDQRDYKDLFDSNNNEVEIKVTKRESYIPYVLENCNNAKLQTWRNYPNIVYIFVDEDCYRFAGIYEWDGNNFIYKTNVI